MNIYDIAERAGVSIATVSRVINGTGSVSEKTKEKVNLVMKELGYTPNVFARGLMVNSMKTLGVLTVDVRDLYYANAIHTIELEAREKGYDVILCSTGENISEKSKYLDILLQKRIDGIILVGSAFKEKTSNNHIINAAEKAPIVMINGFVDAANVYSVICDDAQGIYNSVNYLDSKGYNKIVYLYDVETYSGVEKLKGFKKAAAEKKLDFSPNMIIKTSKGIDGAYSAVDRLINENIDFNAVIASEDILAIGALKRLDKAGLSVPKDVAVIGFNNQVYSRCSSPELTTVDSKVEAVSSWAVKILVDAIEGKNVPARMVITPELVVRETT